MFGWILTLLFIAYICNGEQLVTVSGIQIDEDMQRRMLDLHNNLRNGLALNGIPSSTYPQPRATFMNKLHYDPVLAAVAQRYTNRCYSGHNGARVNDYKSLDQSQSSFNYESSDLSIGENFLYYPRNDDKTIYEDAAYFAESKWWDEHNDYRYSDRYSRGVTGHYTQMAWADTRYIGCGATLCQSGSYQYLLLVCNYYPSGNFYGKWPYPEGTPCTDCAILASDRDVCDGISSGLCSGCQSPSWNLCDDGWTNCAELGCPTDKSCKEDATQFPCEHCKRYCSTCSDTVLSPLPTCNDGFDGLSPVIIPTNRPTLDTKSPSYKPTPSPIPTLPPIPTPQPTSMPIVNTENKYQEIGGVTIDIEFQKTMLNLHNDLRNDLALNGISSSNQPTSTYMNELHFDASLAATAQQYTNKCNSGHNGNRNYEFKNQFGQFSAFYYDSNNLNLGENFLYYPTDGESVYKLGPEFAVEHWWNEHEDFTYSPNSDGSCNGVCGHYTQMAWADTRYVGCGATLCDDWNGNQYLFLICNYYPIGNFYGKPPYPQGTPCTNCVANAGDRDKCDGTTSGLCSGCQSLWWNYCDNIFTNCADLTCPTTKSCQLDSTQYPCNYCRRTCDTCSDAKLSPPDTCDDTDVGFGGGGLSTAPTTTTTTTTITPLTPAPTTTTTATRVTPAPTTTTTTTTDNNRWQIWTCSGYRQCYQYPIKCPVGKHCEINCDGSQTCYKATIQCPANKKCNVKCSGYAACLDLKIYGEESSDVNIDTDGGYQVQLTEWNNNNGAAFIADGDDDDTLDIEPTINGITTSYAVAVLCIILCICFSSLLIGYCYHKKKMNELQSKLNKNDHSSLIQLSPNNTNNIKKTQEIVAEESDEDEDEQEIEVSFDQNQTQ